MCFEPLIENRNSIAVWIAFLFHRHEVSEVLTVVPVAVMDRPALHHEIFENLRVLLFGFLQPESKAEPLLSGHLAVGICFCYRAAVQQKRAPGAVFSWGCSEIPIPRGGELVELPLAGSFPLGQFLEPWHIPSFVFDIARSAIADE